MSLLLSLLVSFSANAGDNPFQGNPGHPAPPPHHVPAPPQHPVTPPQCGESFCDGSYEGFLASQPGILQLEVSSARGHHQCGSAYADVTANWAGATWVGQGVCTQINACQAVLDFQFPNTPPQRGLITVDPNTGAAEMSGGVLGGDAFRLMRR